MTTLTEARRELKRWEKMVEKLQDERCAKTGHTKGRGAFDGYSYCKTCGSQIANADFGRPGKD